MANEAKEPATDQATPEGGRQINIERLLHNTRELNHQLADENVALKTLIEELDDTVSGLQAELLKAQGGKADAEDGV